MLIFFQGTDRFCDDIQEMIGMYPGRFWRYCWKFITPCCLTVSNNNFEE